MAVSEAVTAAGSSDDFRSRGLKARSVASLVLERGERVPPQNGEDLAALSPVYIGGDGVAGDRALLEDLGISHICNVTTHEAEHFPDLCKYMRVAILDSRAVTIEEEVLTSAVEFISQARATGKGLLIHCLWGVSRAPTLACAYMVSCGEDLRSALEKVTAARPAAQPNSSFVKQLIDYEIRVLGKASLGFEEYKAAVKHRATSPASLAALLSAPPGVSSIRKSLSVQLEGHSMFVQQISTSPRMAFVEGFLTHEECDAAVAEALSSGKLHRSLTAPKRDGSSNSETEPNMPSLVSSGRTSSNCRLDRTHPVGVVALSRASYLVGLTPQHAEALQVVHYDKDQKYNAHFDFFQAGLPGYDRRMGAQGQRLVTCFVYLSDASEGGCTHFPELNKRFAPKKGCALVWYNLERDGSLDKRTLHAGEPVLSGEKWGMNIWLRERPKTSPWPA